MPNLDLRILATCIAACMTFAGATVAQPATDADETASVVVMSQWTVKVPFEADASNPKQIGKLLGQSSGNLQPGDRIISINGIKLPRIDALRPMLRMATKPGDKTELPARLVIKRDGVDDTIEELVALPVVQTTVLKNGMYFQTEFVDDIWVTTLIRKPEGVVSDLEIGDKLISYKDEPILNRNSLVNVFQRERRKGMMDFEVTYMRDGVLKEGDISFYTAAEWAAMAEEEEPTLVSARKPLEDLVVMSQWSVRMPMDDADSNDPLAIHKGDRVVSVNGIQVGNMNAISAMLRLSMEPTDKSRLPVDLGIRRKGSQEVTELELDIPIVQSTVLGNGLRFETTHNGDRWETTLIAVPEGVKTDMIVGDQLIAYGTGQPMNQRMSLAKMIEGDRRKGEHMFDFFIIRDGAIKRCYLGYTS